MGYEWGSDESEIVFRFRFCPRKEQENENDRRNYPEIHFRFRFCQHVSNSLIPLAFTLT